jgi:hypothetical protein
MRKAMSRPEPHTLDQLSRAFTEVWETMAANHDGETMEHLRAYLAVTVLQLAGAGERIGEIKVAAEEIMRREGCARPRFA